MTVKFITIKGRGEIARAPFYMGIVQHERTEERRGYASTPSAMA